MYAGVSQFYQVETAVIREELNTPYLQRSPGVATPVPVQEGGRTARQALQDALLRGWTLPLRMSWIGI